MVVVWAIGVYLGLFLAAIVKRPAADPYFYLTGHLTVILTISVLVGTSIYTTRKHQDENANVKDNHSLVDFEKQGAEVYKRNYVSTAFAKLESQFKVLDILTH